jgi:hypothetical protein
MDLATVPSQPTPADELDVSGPAASMIEIDPEDAQVVRTAFAGLVDAAHLALRTVEVDAIHTPLDAAILVERTAAVVHRLSGHFHLYVDDYSAEGARSMGRARDLLRQARAEVSDARNHITLDDQSPATPTLRALAETPRIQVR